MSISSADSTQQERREQLRRVKETYLNVRWWSSVAAIIAAFVATATIAHMGATPGVSAGAWFATIVIAAVGMVVCLVCVALWASACRQLAEMVAEQRAARERHVATEEWHALQYQLIGEQLTALQSEVHLDRAETAALRRMMSRLIDGLPEMLAVVSAQPGSQGPGRRGRRRPKAALPGDDKYMADIAEAVQLGRELGPRPPEATT